MLGSASVHVFVDGGHTVYAGVRSQEELDELGLTEAQLRIPKENLLVGFDARNPESVLSLLDEAKPDIVINAAGIISQQSDSANNRLMVEVNSVWPHALAQFCEQRGARMIHMSTDCVFSGKRGMYKEDDIPDAEDMYGRSKLLGEVTSTPAAVTVRTSIIGWQYGPQVSLAGWFASHRDESLKGYSRAVFSGLPTSALMRAVRDYVVPNERLSGLYQISAKPIDKYGLLKLLAEKMDWQVDLTPDDTYIVDKSLDSSKFQAATGWVQPTWGDMLTDMAKEFPKYYPDGI